MALPPNADAYKTDLPADFKAPDGLKVEFKADDPLLHQARVMAHQMGLSQENFSKLLGLYAGSQVATQQQVAVARNREIAKLGTTGPARIDAITNFFKARLGDTDAAQINSRIFTARDVEVLEKVVAQFSSQGGASFNGRGREAPDMPGRKSPEEISRMSPRERLDYSRSFDQSKMPEWRDPRAA